MNKFRGKALATILAAALVASSLPVTFASAKTRNAKGVLTKDPEQDEFWLVNGGSSKDDRSVKNFQEQIYTGSAPLETADHQDVDDPEVYSISHVSGDKLVTWDIGKDDDNDNDDLDKGDVKLSLRKSDSEGDEVIAVLYKGTYTDDDDNDVDVTASTKITIHAVDENSTVIGDASKVKDDYYDYGDDPIGTDSPELNGDNDDDDNFALKTTDGSKDYKDVAVFKAERANYQSEDKADGRGETDKGCLAEWRMMPTISKAKAEQAVSSHNESDFLKLGKDAQDYAYVLESSTSNNNLDLTDGQYTPKGEDTVATATANDVKASLTPLTEPKDLSLALTDNDAKVTAINASAIVYFMVIGTDTTNGVKIPAKDGDTNGTATLDTSKLKNGDVISIYSSTGKTGSETIGAVVASATSTYAAAKTGASQEIDGLSVEAAKAVQGDVTISNTTKDKTTYDYQLGNADDKIAVAAGKSVVIKGTDLEDKELISIYKEEEGVTKPSVTYTYLTGKAGDPSFYDISSSVVTAMVTGKSTANVTLKAKVTDAYKSAVNKDDDIKAKVKIEKKVLVNDDSSSYTVLKDDTYRDTVMEGNGGDFVGDEVKSNKDVDTSKLDIDGGYIVKFVDKIGNNSADVTFKEDASVDSITGKVGKVKVDDAKKVGTIDLKAGGVAIEDSDVKVDNITTKANSGITNPVISIDADNNVGTITVKKDNDGSSEVDMTAGTAKAIDTKGTVKLTGGEDDKPVTVGTVTARDITLDSTDGAVTVTNVVSNAPDGNENGCAIELDGDKATVKSIDFAGFGTDLKTSDFQGTIPAPQNATAEDATLETSDEDDSFDVSGDLDINTVDVDEDDSDVTFDGKLSVKELEGSGTMYVGANKLYVSDDASGVLVKITDNSIKAGDTIFTAKSDSVEDNDLDFYGFTVKKNEGKGTDTFVVDQLKFAGLAMNKIADKIVLNDSATYTASAYAPGTSIPEGYSIEFDLEDNSGVFELKDNGNGTAAVKCVDYDDTFAEEDKATLKAYVVDEDGDEDDDYGEAECKLTALKTPEKNFTSDTNSDFTVAPGASYQFKITADSAPVMTAGTAGVVNIANVGMSGKDYFIKITATGANGAKTGIYVNGTKLLVVTVGTSQTFKSDTTVNVTVKKGSTYQYGITTSDGKAPFFTVGTGNVFNVKANGHNGSTYFFKITATGKAGAQAGIYVNGTKVNVAKIG